MNQNEQDLLWQVLFLCPKGLFFAAFFCYTEMEFRERGAG